MSIFELHPFSTPSGSFPAAWFDDERCLWKDPRLRRPDSLIADWNAPTLQLHPPEIGATAVLFNPNAYAVSKGVRDELARFPELEFLPVHIKGHGTFFILHVIASCELPEGSKANIPGAPGYNVVGIEVFPPTFEPSMSFFRVRQPSDSAAGRAGSCVFAIYANAVGAQAILEVAGQFLCVVKKGSCLG